MMETITQEAKRLLEPIPEENWMVGDFTDGVSKCCGSGHFMRLRSPGQKYLYSSWTAINTMTPIVAEFNESSIAAVNDGENPKYQQPTPKQRVMALLDDMIAAGL